MMAPKKIGRGIYAALEAIERIGGAGQAVAVTKEVGSKSKNMNCTLNRAVNRGLLRVDRDIYPRQFSAVPGWRDRVIPPEHCDEPYLDQASASAELNNIWDWVLPGLEVAA